MHHTILVSALCLISFSCTAQQSNIASPGPVFSDMGAVYDVSDADYFPDNTQILKAIFDIDRKVEDRTKPNPLITSLHRYYNMHVRRGMLRENIHLAFVVHGSSTPHVLSDAAYRKRYGVDNPNLPYIKALKEQGVQMYICGQSANYAGISKSELAPEINLALSAMTVLTTLQMEGYAMIRF